MVDERDDASSRDESDGDEQSGANPAALPDRRRFLGQVCAGAAAAVGSPALLGASGAEATAAQDDVKPTELPTIQLGPHRVTRLIAGSNPISGYAHSTKHISLHMKEYFTLERTIEFVSRCEKLGINAWQTGHGPTPKVAATLRALRERGSKIHWFCLAAERLGQLALDHILALKPIALVHHGGVTDKLFRENRQEKVHDFIKKVHDAGVLAGVSAHNPRNIAYVEEKGWENDFFMTCLYYITRPEQEMQEELGKLPVGQPFFRSDRDDMLEVVRQVKKPCLAFKILAAGRSCGNAAAVEGAFQYAFSRIKKTDGVIVGMYPRFSDEIAQNIALTAKYGGTAVS